MKTTVKVLKENFAENKIFFFSILAITLFFVFAPHLSFASTTQGAEFNKLYTKMTDWVQGLPGIMFAIALMAAGVYLSFFGNKGPVYFFVATLGAAAIFLIPTIATGLGGAVW